MDRHDMEREIILAQSGELPPARRATLEQRLADDADLRRWRDEVAQVCADAQAALPSPEPSAAAMAAVRERAREPRRGKVLAFPAPVVRLAACAAALAVVVGSWMVWMPEQQTPSDGVAELRSLVALASSYEVDPEVPDAAGETERIRALARELLIMQGLAVDEEAMSQEVLPEERQPTSLRWRSTPASRARIYG